MLSNFKYSIKSRTKILSEISIKISLRNYPGPGKKGVEKVGEEIVKKCIGAECNIINPTIMQKGNKTTLNAPVSAKTENMKKEPVQIFIAKPSNDTFLEKKKIQEPIKSVTDNFPKESLEQRFKDTRMEAGESKNIASSISQESQKIQTFMKTSTNSLEVPQNIRMHSKDPMKAFTAFSLDSMEPIQKEALVVNQKENIDQQRSEGPEDPLIAVRLNSNVSGDTKHVNVGELTEDGKGVVAYGALTSSNDFDSTGKSTTHKISNVKIDGSFIKEPFVQKVENNSAEEPDYIAGYAVGQKTSGQRLRMFEKPREYKKEDFQVSSMAMDFYAHNPDAEQKTTVLVNAKKIENKTPNDLNEDS